MAIHNESLFPPPRMLRILPSPAHMERGWGRGVRKLVGTIAPASVGRVSDSTKRGNLYTVQSQINSLKKFKK